MQMLAKLHFFVLLSVQLLYDSEFYSCFKCFHRNMKFTVLCCLITIGNFCEFLQTEPVLKT